MAGDTSSTDMNFNLRVGDNGVTKCGTTYRVVEPNDNDASWPAYPIVVIDGEGDRLHYTSEGKFIVNDDDSIFDLLPPTHNIDGTKYVYVNGVQSMHILTDTENLTCGFTGVEPEAEQDPIPLAVERPAILWNHTHGVTITGPSYEEQLRDQVARSAMESFIAMCGEADVSEAFDYADAFMAERVRRYAQGN